MGQRHQIYLHMPIKKNYELTSQGVTIGIHHQWLFGQRAITLLANLFLFLKNCPEKKFNPFYSGNTIEATEALQSIYSLDQDQPYFDLTHPLFKQNKYDGKNINPNVFKGFPHECCSNPLEDQCGNNDGITVIYLLEERPKYCFMSINELECVHKSQKSNYENFVPIDAHHYIHLHYPDYLTKTICDCTHCQKDDFQYKQNHNEDITKNMKKCRETASFLSEYDLLSMEEIKIIFPLLFE